MTQLRQMLENQKNSSVPLAEHLQVKEAFEKEVGIIKASLREKEEESQTKLKRSPNSSLRFRILNKR